MAKLLKLLLLQLLGHRGGEQSQSGIHVFDLKTRVLLTTKLQQNAVDCWRFDYSFSSNSIDTVDQNDETLYYPVDMIVRINDDKRVHLYNTFCSIRLTASQRFGFSRIKCLESFTRSLISGRTISTSCVPTSRI